MRHVRPIATGGERGPNPRARRLVTRADTNNRRDRRGVRSRTARAIGTVTDIISRIA